MNWSNLPDGGRLTPAAARNRCYEKAFEHGICNVPMGIPKLPVPATQRRSAGYSHCRARGVTRIFGPNSTCYHQAPFLVRDGDIAADGEWMDNRIRVPISDLVKPCQFPPPTSWRLRTKRINQRSRNAFFVDSVSVNTAMKGANRVPATHFIGRAQHHRRHLKMGFRLNKRPTKCITQYRRLSAAPGKTKFFADRHLWLMICRQLRQRIDGIVDA